MTDGLKAGYTDLTTGAVYEEKPEYMTQLYGSDLVPKDHPRILLRGKLDSLQALVVLDQALVAEHGNAKLVEDLGDILAALREMTRCEVLEEEDFVRETIIGLTAEQLRERSHAPWKFYRVQQLLLPDHTMGRDYALLNQLRAAIREAEVAAVAAFRAGETYTHQDLLRGFNRLSSALHIMMCMYLAGEYGERAGDQ